MYINYVKLRYRCNYRGLFKLFIMAKFIMILLFCTVMQAGAAVYAQLASIKAEHITLKDVFSELREQTGYHFLYVTEDLENTGTVSLNFNDAALETILEKCFEGKSLKYEIKGNMVLIERILASSPSVENDLSTQERTLQGKVNDDKGEALAGVTIQLKGTKKTTQTDKEGKYSLSLPNGVQRVIFSSLGFETKELTVASEVNFLEVVLNIAVNGLDEVAVVGYGTQKRSDLTGSVASVKEADIKATPIVSLDRAMQGRAAGVQVTTNSAKPGGSTTIRIRGTGSVNASNEPLYVIDGYPSGDLNSINPADIASLEILKDASATAIYGSRGSNGVVMITTKHGSAGQSNISLDSYYGIQSLSRKIPLLNAKQYAEFINEARVNAGGEPYFDGSSEQRPKVSDIGIGTDWQDEVFHNAPIQNHELSFNGGDDKTNYALSGSYYGQNGIIIGSNFKRYTIRANIDRKVRSWLKIGLTMQGAHTNSNNSRTETEGGGKWWSHQCCY
ncbi:TonB-linked outer membrane protein, SusC/RagA family [bacterium A37T11]|nr:TonB-linked outer membrane protein, SusC/RagA family [bacterium A37T11]